MHDFVAVEKLLGQRRQEESYFQKIGTEIPETALLAMQTELGDSVWLDTARSKSNGECRVFLMSHETGTEEREWSSIAEFLEELLTEETPPEDED